MPIYVLNFKRKLLNQDLLSDTEPDWDSGMCPKSIKSYMIIRNTIDIDGIVVGFGARNFGLVELYFFESSEIFWWRWTLIHEAWIGRPEDEFVQNCYLPLASWPEDVQGDAYR